MGALAEQAAPHLKPGAVVTDTGSVSGHVAERLQPIFGSRYVAGHPIAGKELHGVHAADPDLFQDKAVILSPDARSDQDAIDKVTALWHWLGAHTITMSARDHDRVFACVSHLPHLAAFALMGAVSAARTAELDPAAFAAGGLRDFTRVAASDPLMWRDICLTNKAALLEMLDLYGAQLATVRRAIETGDGQALTDLFAHANTVRARMAQ
jgi:cyclohexadieny/prephenate dehydrogenase